MEIMSAVCHRLGSLNLRFDSQQAGPFITRATDIALSKFRPRNWPLPALILHLLMNAIIWKNRTNADTSRNEGTLEKTWLREAPG